MPERARCLPGYLLHLSEVIVKLGPFGPSDLLTDQLGDRKGDKCEQRRRPQEPSQPHPLQKEVEGSGHPQQFLRDAERGSEALAPNPHTPSNLDRGASSWKPSQAVPTPLACADGSRVLASVPTPTEGHSLIAQRYGAQTGGCGLAVGVVMRFTKGIVHLPY